MPAHNGGLIGYDRQNNREQGMEVVSIADAKARLSELVARVQAGEIIRIARDGIVVARLEPHEFDAQPD